MSENLRKSLLAAFLPEAGESGADLSGKFPGSTLGPTLAPPVPDGKQDLYIIQDKFPPSSRRTCPAARPA